MGLFSSADERAKNRQEKQEVQKKAQKLVVPTAGLNSDYSILGIIRAESLTALKESAVRKGANAVIGVGFFGYDEQCYGTAITFKEDPQEADNTEQPKASQDEI